MNFSRFVIVVGILFTIFGLVYTFQGVDFGRVVSAVQGLQGRPFWISQAFFLSSLLLRAIRWRYLLLNLKRLPFMPVFAATVIGMFVNNVLPARIGELARAAFLGRREHVSTTSIFANVVVERIVDLFSLLVFLCVYLLFSGGKSENDALLENTGWVLLGGSVCLAAGLFLLTRFESHVKGFTAALVRPWSVSVYERLERGIRSFASGLDVFQSWTQVIVIISLSLGIWLSGVASFFYLLESFSIPLHFLQVLLVFCIVVIGIALPSAPGFVGTFHAFTVAGLSMVGITDASLAAAYATVLHGMSWIIVNLLGAYFLLREGKDVWSSFRRESGHR